MILKKPCGCIVARPVGSRFLGVSRERTRAGSEVAGHSAKIGLVPVLRILPTPTTKLSFHPSTLLLSSHLFPQLHLFFRETFLPLL